VIAMPAVRVQTTAVAVQLAAPARAVHGSDGREHVEYDLVTTNTFTSPVKLDSILIRGAGRRLLSLTGKKLAAYTFALSATRRRRQSRSPRPSRR